MYSLKYASEHEQVQQTGTSYYQKLEQCLKCRRLYPVDSSGSKTLCIYCMYDRLAQEYKLED